jgi:predicted 2-oxoglutarate/Fe(II)-dependent dioxygenase YbiX
MTRVFEPLIKKDFFTPDELELIWYELKLMSHPKVVNGPDLTKSATVDGVIQKTNKGIFFNEYFRDVTNSATFRAAGKIFEGITEEFADLSFVNSPVLQTGTSSMLLSYYEDSDYYKPHQDRSITTVLYWFCQEPKAFTGGDLVFPEIDMTVPFENNMMVMFPSVGSHAVTEVRLDPDSPPYSGRFAVTHFLNF